MLDRGARPVPRRSTTGSAAACSSRTTDYAERARRAWAELLGDLAVVVRAFGALLRAEVEGEATEEETAVADALDRLRLDRVRHADALLADPREHPDLWELDGAARGLVDRMLLELDTAAHAQLWEDRRREIVDLHTRRAARPAPLPAADRAAARPDAPPARRSHRAGSGGQTPT